MHSDVGGGYRERGLSDCASHWMLSEARKFGLEFESHYLDAVMPDPGAKQHNERRGIYRARGQLTRNIRGAVHTTAKQRWDADAQNYRKKSKSLNSLLASVGGNWDRIDVTD